MSQQNTDKLAGERTQRKYIMGGFVLPVKRECVTVGASGKVRVIDAKGRLIKAFDSTRLANALVNSLNET